ncbi:hypothetical protein Gotri_008760 [Gossypium trilobum]|uniref:Uncharacterized protein n=1 Tax=Gossypium trilobum TaxID=34281 RepID=A0A7J9EKA9_9ROSI|nr:hypothetical protein [Gossypium trilobum]
MARLAISFIAIFVLFTVSHARFIVPDQAVTSEEIVAELPESDSTTTNVILLPNEKPNSEPAKTVDSKHDVDDASEADPDLVSSIRLGHQIRGRWTRFPNNGAESKEHVDFRKVRPYNHEHEQDHDNNDHHPHHHHHYQHQRRHHRRGEEDERRESEEKDWGFIKRFRKFLINF